MPLISGPITPDGGAVITVQVGVSHNRAEILRRHGMGIPEPVAVPAMIDTGSYVTLLRPAVFESLGLTQIGTVAIRTPSTSPGNYCECPQFDVSLQVGLAPDVSYLASVLALASEDFQADEEVQALIGRDVLRYCVLQYFGPESRFELAVQFPG